MTQQQKNSKDIIETSPNILYLWFLVLIIILLNNFASNAFIVFKTKSVILHCIYGLKTN